MEQQFGRWLIPLIVCAVFSIPAVADDDKTDDNKLNITLGGFVDTFYAFDFNTPSSMARNYGNPNQLVSTAGRHNEFNINLAYLEAKLSSDRVRARVALQSGSSVQAVYLGEILNDTSNFGTTGALLRLLQEAVVGYRLGEGLWIDAGIYLSYIGLESFISKDNWTYTRSFMADFSPYYFAGVKLSYEASKKVSLQLHVTNGWQNIIETNSNKSVGTQIAYQPSESVSFIWSTFYGEETGTLWRFFNDFILKMTLARNLELAATADVGFQRQPGSGSASAWYGLAIFARYRIFSNGWLTARYERYSDPDRVIVQPANTSSAFIADSASLNLDVELWKNLFWRNEVRASVARDPVFASNDGYSNQDWLGVSSLSLSF